MPLRTIAIVCSLVLAGCTPTVVDTSCTSFEPITYNARGDTVLQVRRHNAAWEAVRERQQLKEAAGLAEKVMIASTAVKNSDHVPLVVHAKPLERRFAAAAC